MLRARTLGVILAAAAAVGAGSVASCTIFDFPRPSDAPPSLPAGYLDMPTAGRFCAQVFRCPEVAHTITQALAIPLDIPTSVLGFSSCMDWVAGPMDPNRPGLMQQQTILEQVANASSCDSAATAVPVQQIAEAGVPCPNAALPEQVFCLDEGTFGVCDTKLGTFAAGCNSALFGTTPQTCFSTDGGGVLSGYCLSTTTGCTLGKTCPDHVTLRECLPAHLATDYNCALSGRVCAAPPNMVGANCVVQNASEPPCVDGGSVDDCDMSSVRHCSYIEQTEFKCDAVGFVCSASNDGHVPRCAPEAGAQCNPFDVQQNVCAGDKISVCIGGRQQSFDCTSIGLHCMPATNGGAFTAHCG